MKYAAKYAERFAVLFVIILTAGCTTRAAYEAVRQNERSTCDRVFADSERAKCLARTQDDYDTYSEKRRAVAEDPAPGTTR